MYCDDSAAPKCNLCHICICNTEDYLCVMLSDREMMIHAKNNAFIFYFLALTSSAVFTWRYPGRICTFFSVVVWFLHALSMNGAGMLNHPPSMLIAVLIPSPRHFFLTLISLFCREINVEAAPHLRERRAPRLRRRNLSCSTMWTDTVINTHIITNKWCCGFLHSY